MRRFSFAPLAGLVIPALVTAALVTAALLAAAPARADQDEWCASPWGPDDEIGAANRMTPDSVARAAQLVKTGKVYALGVETNAKTPAFGARTFNITITQPGQAGGTTTGPTKGTSNDDLINGWSGVGSQIDGLGHIGIDHVYYNCNRAEDFTATDGLKKLGIENIPPLVARGVLLDMTAVLGADPQPAGTAINRGEIDAAMKRQGVRIGEGDVVLLHTGWQAVAATDPERFKSGEPGLGKDGAAYLASLGVMAVGADQWGVEVVPFEGDSVYFEVHQLLLARNGIYILENMVTAPLVADEAWEFMFVLSASRITGAVQGIVNPVAIR